MRVIMSYSRSLRRALKDKNESLFNRLEPIGNAARSVLTYTISKFPYYTPHDFSHSQNVEEILNWLVPDDIKTKMNGYEIFFLLVSAWLHDWGMVASESENPEEVRKFHNVRTEANFEKLYDKIYLSHVEARIVGRICRGHRQEDLLDSKYDDSFVGSNILVRVRFLAALLRIADECDVTANRTPEIIYYSLKPEGASEEEFQKHLSISGIGKLTPYKLQISGIAKTPKGVEVIEGVKNQIQNQLNSVKAILGSHGVVLDIVEAHIDTRGFINKPIEFELDRKSIVNLLIGSSLYSRVDVAVRELLQNAVDTCRFRKLFDNDFEPCIDIEFGRGELSFEDNGIGMSFEDAFNYFSKKGHSFYVSKDFKDALMGKRFDPISKFGIGVLSAFIISDKMVVETKKDNCAPCRFTITDLSEGWTYEEGSRQRIGTKITLILNNEGKKLDILKSLQHYAKNVEIPIFMKDADTGKREQFVQSWGYDIPETREKLPENQREKFLSEKPLLTMHVGNSELEVTYYVFSEDYYFVEQNCFLLQNGIYVGGFDLFSTRESNWIALIDCKSNLVDLKVSREDLVENKKLSNFLSILYDDLIQAASLQCAEKYGSKLDDLAKTVSLSSLLRQFVGSEILVEKTDELPALIFAAKRTYPVLFKGVLTISTIDQIRPQQFKQIIHYKLPLENFKEHIKIAGDILPHKINEETAVVFDFGPFVELFSSESETSQKLQCGFREILRSIEKTETRCLGLRDLVAELEFEKLSTPIDFLLPDSSFFAHMPEPLRGIIINPKPFKFIQTKRERHWNLERDIAYNELVGRELFKVDPEIRSVFDSRLFGAYEDAKLVSQGYFVYDCDDQFLKSIISRADYVLSNELVKKSVERYLRALALCSIGRGRFDFRLEIVILEKTIAEMLGILEGYTPFYDRISDLAKISLGFRGWV